MKPARLLAAALLALVLLAALGQARDPNAVDLSLRFAGLSWAHPLGTDHLGRDLLARLVDGGWRTGAVILIVGAAGFFGGATAGGVAAILGGLAESLVLRAAETFIAVPTLIVALVAAAIFGLSPLSAGLALGLAGLGPYALLAHTLTRRALGETYVQAARALGVPRRRLILAHILPSILPLLLAYVGGEAGGSAVAYASLGFIGLGADPTQADWGGMLFEYRPFLFDHVGLVLAPGLALLLTAGGLNLVFDRRDVPSS